jgi:hypothetical protein
MRYSLKEEARRLSVVLSEKVFGPGYRVSQRPSRRVRKA